MPQRSGQLSAPSGDRGHVHGVTRRRGVAGTYGHRGSWHTAPGKPDASCPKQACFMIVARNGQITSGTGHDHEQRPRCLKVKSRHNGIALRPAVDATRRRRSRPQRGPGQQQSPEIRHHGPLEFLALRRTGPRAHPPQTGTLVLARNDSLRRSFVFVPRDGPHGFTVTGTGSARAVGALRDEGLVCTVPQGGTYVEIGPDSGSSSCLAGRSSQFGP